MKILIAFFLFCSLPISVVAQKKFKTENVILVTLDGLRWQELFSGAEERLMLNKDYVRDPLGLKNSYWHENELERRKMLMPFFWEVIAKQGQLYGNRKHQNFVNCTNGHRFSYPGYSEILCGFSDDARIKTNNKIENPNETVLEFINRQPLFKGKVAAFGSWDLFPYIINEKRSGIPVNGGFEAATGEELSEKELFLNQLQQQIPSPWSNVRLDAFTHHYALEYVRKHHPRVLFIAYGETDDFAHDGRYDAYLNSAHQSDKFIEDLWNFLQNEPQYKGRTTMIITTDHGRGTEPVDAWKNHGKDVPGADQIWLAVIGPDTPMIGELKTSNQFFQNQIANTLAAFLQIHYTNKIKPGDIIKPAIGK